MPTLTSVSLIEETAAYAKSGNRLLAEHHFRKVMQESNDTIEDPAVWLMMAWLAPSPQAMKQALERLLIVDPGNEVAQFGLRWAQGIDQLVVEPIEVACHDYGFSAKPDLESPEEIVSDSETSFVQPPDRTASIETIDAIVQQVSQTFGTPAELNTEHSAEVRQELQTSAIAGVSSVNDLSGNESITVQGNRSTISGAAVTTHATGAALNGITPTSSNTSSTVSDPSKRAGEGTVSSPAATSKIAKDLSQDWVNVELPSAQVERNETLVATPSEVEELDSIPADWPHMGAAAAVSATEKTVTQSESGAVQENGDTSATSEFDDAEEIDADSDPIAALSAPSSAGSIAAPVRGTPEDSKNKSGGPSILVVDDSPTVRKLLTMMLTQGGYEVSSAVDGLDAVQAIAARVPQLIITDINMPRLDGYKLCKLVTRNARTRHIPVVMISAGIIDRLRGKLAGCSGYLVKPITPGSLNAVVEFALQGATAH